MNCLLYLGFKVIICQVRPFLVAKERYDIKETCCRPNVTSHYFKCLFRSVCVCICKWSLSLFLFRMSEQSLLAYLYYYIHIKTPLTCLISIYVLLFFFFLQNVKLTIKWNNVHRNERKNKNKTIFYDITYTRIHVWHIVICKKQHKTLYIHE